ncbi:hypothetical protein F0L68_04205 [Solihabitans fulvus]|uniref:DinB-like domain-containing protein n=1 Tax=Solihabitans fulvus TaxID=1892852 RepID=A0A5B2XSC6_9PSEU|nr:DinB family protein [Solihabitans fulvus]KAA2265771.1 hypothetical protein F0L68_04205 [Solihabitans fulvus]
MSQRAEQLAARLDEELSRMGEFVSGLTAAQLDAACKDPRGVTVRHVLDHLREGIDLLLTWSDSVTSGSPAGVDVPAPHTHAHSHDPANAAADVATTVAALREGGSAFVSTVRGLTDQQLDSSPPPTESLTNGSTPLHEIVAFIADDVAGHLTHLKEAVGAGARVHQDAT